MLAPKRKRKPIRDAVTSSAEREGDYSSCGAGGEQLPSQISTCSQ